MMTKSQAAEYLGISTRQVTNYANQGKLSVRYEKGKTGDVAIFDERELRKLKAELDSKRAPRGAVIRADETPTPESPETLPALVSRPSDLAALQSFAARFLGQPAPTPAATIGEILEVKLERPRERLALANDPTYTDLRAQVLRFLYEKQRKIEPIANARKKTDKARAVA